MGKRVLNIQVFDIKIANLLFTAKTAERKIIYRKKHIVALYIYIAIYNIIL